MARERHSRAGAARPSRHEPAHPLQSYLGLNNVWTVETKAHHCGFDDVVPLNERGEVAERTAADLFIVKNRRVAAPRTTTATSK